MVPSQPEQRYIWQSSPSDHYHSFWMLIQKFARNNYISLKETFQLFGSNYSSYKNKPYCLNPWNINDIHCNAISEVLKIDIEQIKYTTFDGYINSHNDSYYVDYHIKYCKDCFFDHAFHSPLYQLSWLTKCPIHNTEFETCCPSCHRPISLLFKSSDKNSELFICKCGYTPTIESFEPIENHVYFNRFLEVFNWHLSIKNISDFSCRLKGIRLHDMPDYADYAPIFYFIDIVDPPGTIKDITNYDNDKIYHQLKFKSDYDEPVTASVTKRFAENYSTARSIVDLHTKNHSKCLRVRHILDSKYRHFYITNVCPVANAIDLWLFYWRQKKHMLALLRNMQSLLDIYIKSSPVYQELLNKGGHHVSIYWFEQAIMIDILLNHFIGILRYTERIKLVYDNRFVNQRRPCFPEPNSSYTIIEYDHSRNNLVLHRWLNGLNKEIQSVKIENEHVPKQLEFCRNVLIEYPHMKHYELFAYDYTGITHKTDAYMT